MEFFPERGEARRGFDFSFGAVADKMGSVPMGEDVFPRDPRSVLLLRLGGLGDLLAVLPAVRLLGSLFPEAKLTLACREEYGILFHRSGLVHSLESVEGARMAGLFASAGEKAESSDAWLSGFDSVLGWFQGSGGDELQAAASRARVPARFLSYEPLQGLAIGRWFFEETARLVDPGGRARAFEGFTGLPIDAETRKWGADLAASAGLDPRKPFVVMHPGTGSRRKRWPFHSFLEVAGRLSGRETPGVLVTGEAEDYVEAALDAATIPSGWGRLSCPALPALAGLLARSALYLGNDSGITHLAASCGTKVLALFLKEFETAWTPAGRATVISGESIEDISTEEVIQAVDRALSNSKPSR